MLQRLKRRFRQQAGSYSGSSQALASVQAGDFIVRAPNEQSGNLKLDGAKVQGIKATLDGPSALGVDRTKVSVDVDPWVYMVSVGYKF